MFDTLFSNLKAHSHFSVLRDCTPGVDCDECPNVGVDSTVLPLCRVQQGKLARVVHVSQEPRLRKRLADLGIAVGMDVRVVRSSFHSGPMILAVRSDARLAVGWEMARQIEVQVKDSSR